MAQSQPQPRVLLVTRTLITRPDGSQVVSVLPVENCRLTYGASGCKVEAVQGFETAFGFRGVVPGGALRFGVVE